MDVTDALALAADHLRHGRLAEAEAVLRAEAARSPNRADVRNDLGIALAHKGEWDEAIAELAEAVRLDPALGTAHGNLGTILRQRGRPAEAAAALARAVAIEPGWVDAHRELAGAREELLDFAGAAESYAQVLRLAPDDRSAHVGRGAALRRQDRPDEAIGVLAATVRRWPDLAEAHYHLGGAQFERGELDEGLASYRTAMALRPANAAFHSAYALAVHFHPSFDAAAVLAEQRRWDERHGRPHKASIRPHANCRDPERRLRVGYVSPYFRSHVIGQWILPLLEAHDRAVVDVVAYSDARRTEGLGAALRAACDGWRDTARLSDDELAALIRGDAVDVLVDLTMHMGNNRLPVFARKPAPVQVAYLAYPSTTGLEAIDYRLTDPYLDPPGAHDAFYSERSVRLPEVWYCYQPRLVETPEPGAPPSLASGHITFGCLNNLCKVTPEAISAWCAILRAVHRSRLLLHGREGSLRQRIAARVAAEGVDVGRLSFVGLKPPAEYFRLYHGIDVTLDPFPYSGGTTTCDALWMGVPVVSLVGHTAVARQGLTILSNIGLPELAAADIDAYCRIAIALARDPDRLRSLRAGLRDRMLRSPLTDAPRFARNVEAAFRRMWRAWCAGGSGGCV